MREAAIQVGVGLQAVVIAAIKSMQFSASRVTDFELQRQAEAQQPDALLEQGLRRSRSLLIAGKHIIALIVSIALVGVLVWAYPLPLALGLSALWLLIAEFLAVRPWFGTFVHRSISVRPLLAYAEAVRPMLKLFMKTMGDSSGTQLYSIAELEIVVKQTGSFLSAAEQQRLMQALHYSTGRIADYMVPIASLPVLKKADTIGPVLLDEMHTSGRMTFPVVGSDKSQIVGSLSMRDALMARDVYKVGDVYVPGVAYVNEDEPLQQVVDAFLHTQQHLFIVVNKSEKITGVIDIQDIILYLLGHSVDEFDRYEDRQVVAQLTATTRQRSNPK
jgi:CBS domain containing-hemolysin-like protein